MAKRARPVVRLLAVIAGLAAAASAFGADIVDAAQRNDRAAVLAALEQGADARAIGGRHDGLALGRLPRRRGAR